MGALETPGRYRPLLGGGGQDPLMAVPVPLPGVDAPHPPPPWDVGKGLGGELGLAEPCWWARWLLGEAAGGLWAQPPFLLQLVPSPLVFQTPLILD